MTTTTMNKSSFIQLYRTILQCHKKYLVDDSMRNIGNKYVRNEFKLHKNITNEQQINQFTTEWENYIIQLTFSGQSQQIYK
jgi:Complex1_LYR-like